MNFPHRIGFRMFELFRKIDEDFGGSISWNTQPNCRAFDESFSTGLPVLPCCSSFFNTATALLSPLFLDLCWAVRQPRDARKSTFPQICNHSWTCRTIILEEAIFHRMKWCKFLCGTSLQDHRNILPLGILPLGLRVFDAFLSFCCIKELGDEFGCVNFARLLMS